MEFGISVFVRFFEIKNIFFLPLNVLILNQLEAINSITIISLYKLAKRLASAMWMVIGHTSENADTRPARLKPFISHSWMI